MVENGKYRKVGLKSGVVLEIPEDDYRFFERQVEDSKIMTSRKTAEDLINSVYGEHGEYGGLVELSVFDRQTGETTEMLLPREFVDGLEKVADFYNLTIWEAVSGMVSSWLRDELDYIERVESGVLDFERMCRKAVLEKIFETLRKDCQNTEIQDRPF